MTRLTIGHYRAMLAGHAGASSAIEAYRELARCPEVARGMLHNEWALWTAARPSPAGAGRPRRLIDPPSPPGSRPMPRITIEQFRAKLAGRGDTNPVVNAYRDIARRPELAAAMGAVDWVAWPPAAPHRASA